MAGTADEHRMSDAETLLWRIERDPALSSTFANVTILDRAPDVERLRRRMERTARRVPRLRQIVRPSPVDLGRPSWVDDPDFDVRDHVRHVALADPPTDRRLFDLATRLTADPFDHGRPLWEFVVVEGLAGGRAALIEKLHHAIADGEAGVALAFEFLDLERDAPDPSDAPDGTDGRGAAGDPVTDDAPDDAAGTGPDGMGRALRDAASQALRLPVGVARRTRELLAEPDRIPAATDEASETLRRVVEQFFDSGSAGSPLWTRRSTRRHLEVATAPAGATRSAAKRLGGTLNTAFLTIAADAAGRYHRELGHPVDSLHASMAISTRTERSGTNAFTVVRVPVPTGELPIDERFRTVQSAARRAGERGSAVTVDAMAGLAPAVPTRMLIRLARQQARTVDFATSNVRGSDVPVYVAGARLLHNYPIGPLVGVAFNLTLLSYLDHLDMGLHVDAGAVERPELLRRSLEDAVERFAAC